MPIAPADLHSALLGLSGEPIVLFGDRGSLHLLHPPRPASESRWVDQDALWTTARLVSRRADGLIGQIKEQEVAVVMTDGDPERLPEMLAGWAEVVERVLCNPDAVGAIMPGDLFSPKILRLKRPTTAADFAAAFSMRSRLGRFFEGVFQPDAITLTDHLPLGTATPPHATVSEADEPVVNESASPPSEPTDNRGIP